MEFYCFTCGKRKEKVSQKFCSDCGTNQRTATEWLKPCLSCGTRPKIKQQKFCAGCGNDIRQRFCKNCGKEVEKKWTFCVYCGEHHTDTLLKPIIKQEEIVSPLSGRIEGITVKARVGDEICAGDILVLIKIKMIDEQQIAVEAKLDSSSLFKQNKQAVAPKSNPVKKTATVRQQVPRQNPSPTAVKSIHAKPALKRKPAALTRAQTMPATLPPPLPDAPRPSLVPHSAIHSTPQPKPAPVPKPASGEQDRHSCPSSPPLPSHHLLLDFPEPEQEAEASEAQTVTDEAELDIIGGSYFDNSFNPRNGTEGSYSTASFSEGLPEFDAFLSSEQDADNTSSETQHERHVTFHDTPPPNKPLPEVPPARTRSQSDRLPEVPQPGRLRSQSDRLTPNLKHTPTSPTYQRNPNQSKSTMESWLSAAQKIPKCFKCGISVYTNEGEVRSEGRLFHPRCFRCNLCNNKLSIHGDIAMYEKEQFCKPCYKQKFLQSGGRYNVFNK